MQERLPELHYNRKHKELKGSQSVATITARPAPYLFMNPTTAADPQPATASPASPSYTVVSLAPSGLGYGEGPISLESRKDQIDDAMLRQAVRAPEILVAVDVDSDGHMLDDDGCGDGRKTVTVYQGQEIHKRSLNRAKVFGGGVTMTLAAMIGQAKITDIPLNEAFRQALKTLQSYEVNYGAHTCTEHASDASCGCGAIDKANVILQNVIKYGPQIMGTLQAIDTNMGNIDDVMKAYEEYAQIVANDKTFTGREVANDIINSGVVVKDLGDEHKEVYIVLNHMPGMTVNQEYVRQVSNDAAQVFAVDVWRLQELARRTNPGNPVAEHEAYLSELVYTLAVAATLTNGDLPVFVVRPNEA